MKKNRLLVVLLSIVLLFQIVFFAMCGKQELSQLYEDSKYQSGQVEQNVQDTINFVDYMNIVATDHFSGENDKEYYLYDELIYDSINDIYYINENYVNSEGISTTVGNGGIPISEEVLAELNLAYTFSDFFVSFYENNDNVTWVYYVSESGFISVYPSLPAEQLGNPLEFQDSEYYQNALPENNPKCEAVWTDVYIDKATQDEIVTLSMPIYDGSEFKGVLAVDRSISDIEEIFQSKYDTYLLDDDGSVIASNTSISGSSENVSCVTEEELVNIESNTQISENEIEFIDGNFLYTNQIANTDWIYTAIIPASELLVVSIVKSSPIIIIAIIGIVVYSINQRRKEQIELQKYNEFLEETVSDRTKEIRLTQEVTIESVSALAESRDSETGNHILRTKVYVQILAEELSKTSKYSEYMTPERIRDISMSAPLHDIGKVGIKDSILQKAGKLTDEEYSEMKLHTLIGANALIKASEKFESSSFLDCAISMARSHHEKWDGTGYPEGLAGVQIPISARIMSVADVYDALRSARVYKPAMSHEKAYEIILSESGKAFDPLIVEAFVKNNDKFMKISEEYSE